METTTVALGVATLVVLILLMSCAGASKSKAASNCPRPAPPVVIYQDLDGGNDHQMSKWGQGVYNRQAGQRQRDLQNLNEYDDYNSVAQYESLEPEVFSSHEDYSSNIGISSSGASSMTTLSHDNYPVQFVGLRRPDMHSIYAGAGARQQHSEFVDQMPARAGYML